MEVPDRESDTVFPLDWDNFSRLNEDETINLAKIKPEAFINLQKNAQELFSIWSVLTLAKEHINKNGLFKALYESVYAPSEPCEDIEQLDSDSVGLVNKLRQLLGEQEDPMKDKRSESPDYRGLRLLKGTDVSTLVTGDFEQRHDNPDMNPTQMFVKELNNYTQNFISNAEERFPDKADNKDFILRVAKLVSARYFLHNLAQWCDKKGMRSKEISLVLNRESF